MDAAGETATGVATRGLEDHWERQEGSPGSETAAFVGYLVHEVRSPLTVILGNAYRLARRNLGDDSDESLDDIVRAARRLDEVLNDWTELTVHPYPMTSAESFALDAVTRAAISEHRNIHPQRRISASVRFRPCTALGSPSWTRQILCNLLSNAEKYSAPVASIEVELLALEDRGELAVHVRDRGIGLPDDTEELFEPFWRAPAARRMAGGMGMGLAAS